MPCTPISVLIIWHSLDKAISVLAQSRIILSVSLYKGVQHLFERNPKAFFKETAVRSSFKEVQESMEEGHHSFRIESLKYLLQMTMVFQKESFTVEGQRGPKRGFPTLRCDAPGRGWRCDALGGGWRCDAATLERRCDAVGAATRDPRCDAVGATTLRRCDAGATLRRCWRCDATFCQSAHGVAGLISCDAQGAPYCTGAVRGWCLLMLKT